MRLRRVAVAAAAMAAFVAAPAASASPVYDHPCGDGTPHGCILHCYEHHGGLDGLGVCFRYHRSS